MSDERTNTQPNILVIMGDDIGWSNLSCYNHGMVGWRTPQIDRLAKEGVMFTDAYGQQSCTAGRAAFILGQCPKRTGLLKIGMPGDKDGIDDRDPTLAKLLKPHGYVTAQFGKNHLGDQDQHLPTMHGFDEFFGNLYHLNSEEEPEQPDYPKDPAFRERYGPRGVLRSKADGNGGQTVEDTGPLTKKRMETVDEEFLDATTDFIERAVADGKPFFVWFNTTRMHAYTHLKPESVGLTEYGFYADGMTEHDAQIGELLDSLDDLGVADNTIVIYTTDNGAQKFGWPDAALSPFHGEKATTWEGGVRIPMLARWPGHIDGGQVSNEIISLEDLLPTLMSAVGVPDIKEKLLNGHEVDGTTYKVHLDGYDFMPHLRGEAEAPREEFYYFVDDGSLGAMRHKEWKASFSVQQQPGIDAWYDPQFKGKAPLLVNLRTDPYEDAPESSMFYGDFMIRHMWVFAPIKDLTASYAQSYVDFPPRRDSGSFVPKQ